MRHQVKQRQDELMQAERDMVALKRMIRDADTENVV